MKAIFEDITMAPWCGTEPAAVVLGELEIRPALPDEMQRVATLLNDEHYLGAGRQVGRTLVQIVHHRERWTAILVWGPAAMKLIDRDEWIGWTQQQRAERLGLIVQNRRFLVLAETRMPNLASRAMGLALRNLPEQWQEKHGYCPLLAETFTDIESFEGTCYKASNWEPCGLTKGFEPTHRADFYREHKRPKKLWLKTLSRNTRVILTGLDIPAAYQPGCNLQTAERALPLKKAQIESLRDALRNVPDPRADNRSWPISTLLTLICMGLFAGRKSLASIHRYGQFLTQQQRGWLNFPSKLRGKPGRRSPSYKALYNLLGKLDPNDLADTLNAWLAAHHGTLPRALALDGKYIRDLLLTLALSEHESGAPVAITIASKEPKSEASKTEGEITAAKRLYEKVDLRNAVVTGDALHCERENMQLIIENEGDFLFQLKGNQPTALTEAERIAVAGSPLLPAKPKIAGTVG
jgi:Domain of unknown function (DUF4338)/DDE_Tnp_1-associated